MVLPSNTLIQLASVRCSLAGCLVGSTRLLGDEDVTCVAAAASTASISSRSFSSFIRTSLLLSRVARAAWCHSLVVILRFTCSTIVVVL